MGQSNITPGLGTILVGDDGPSERYVAMKHADCREVGIRSFHRAMGATTSQEELESVVDEFNENPEIHSYLIQLPLPAHLDETRVLLRVNPDKDVDGLHPTNLGRLVLGDPGPIPCTPAGILELVVQNGVPIVGRHVVVVGRGITIGRPLALLLATKRPNCNAAVTVVHTGVPNLGYYTSQADIVIAAAGHAGLITKDMIKPGACVVGAGVSREGKKILSDLADDVGEVAGFVTPRIGGVGPMTRAMLLVNAVDAAERTIT